MEQAQNLQERERLADHYHADGDDDYPFHHGCDGVGHCGQNCKNMERNERLAEMTDPVEHQQSPGDQVQVGLGHGFRDDGEAKEQLFKLHSSHKILFALALAAELRVRDSASRCFLISRLGNNDDHHANEQRYQGQVGCGREAHFIVQAVAEHDEKRSQSTDGRHGGDGTDGGGCQAEQLGNKLERAHGEIEFQQASIEHKTGGCYRASRELFAQNGEPVAENYGCIAEHKTAQKLELANKHREVKLLQDLLGELRGQAGNGVPAKTERYHLEVHQMAL
ncbi:hypothetical protein OGAPHI_004796 [Ogataea philodendri]|uniref:Uncharacterized protein n=1 Tax=Ogataea philodendri TaxID=1378263 RepID=A0A9P8P2P2_9ASCO|nr:uncharacterized protein OGAPHI_004796 [Ogataea philodendri]KAH3664082.1 hypothetical protein OGAPHI_004796 [Ogataea philodendri]